jgi:hypothetical protein
MTVVKRVLAAGGKIDGEFRVYKKVDQLGV